MGDPHVAPVCIVFDQDETPAGAQVAAYQLQDGVFVAHEMEGVSHYDTIQQGKIESPGKIGGDVMDGGGGKAGSHGSFLLSKRSRIPVHGIDLARGSDQIGQREREGSRSRAELGPGAAWPRHAFLQEIDMILMVHILLSLCLSDGRNSLRPYITNLLIRRTQFIASLHH